MLKNFLRAQPSSVQFLFLMIIWMLSIGAFQTVLALVMTRFMDIPAASIGKFLSDASRDHPDFAIVSNGLGALATFLLPALLFAGLMDDRPLSFLGFRSGPTWSKAGLVVVMAVFLVPFIGIMGTWIKNLDLGVLSDELEAQRSKMLEAYIVKGSWPRFLVHLFFIALLPALCEELFFRGVLMRFAHRWTRSAWAAISLSALVFALFHQSIAQFLPIFVAGVVLGWVYYFTSNIGLAILLHFLNNGLQLFLLFVSGPDTGEKSVLGGFDFLSISLWCVSGAMVIALALGLKRKGPLLPEGWSISGPRA